MLRPRIAEVAWRTSAALPTRDLLEKQFSPSIAMRPAFSYNPSLSRPATTRRSAFHGDLLATISRMSTHRSNSYPIWPRRAITQTPIIEPCGRPSWLPRTASYYCSPSLPLSTAASIKRRASSRTAITPILGIRQYTQSGSTIAALQRRGRSISSGNWRYLHHHLDSRAFTKRPEPYIVQEIRGILSVTTEYGHSIWKLGTRKALGLESQQKGILNSDAYYTMKRISRLYVSVLPEYRWTYEPYRMFRGYWRANAALRQFLLTDARNYLSENEREAFARLLESDRDWIIIHWVICSVVFYGLLMAIARWKLKKMGIIRTASRRSTGEL